MNYLAHLLLAGTMPEALAGALLGDFVKGPVPARASSGVTRGIVLHRKIDVFTDSHPVPRLSRDRFPSPLRRYAGIIVDLSYDHFLAINWARYCQIPLSDFTTLVYKGLGMQRSRFSGRALEVMQRMREQDWLGAYTSTSSVTSALRSISARLSRPNPLGCCGAELEVHYAALGSDFERFFPQLVTHCDGLHAALGTSPSPLLGPGARAVVR